MNIIKTIDSVKFKPSTMLLFFAVVLILFSISILFPNNIFIGTVAITILIVAYYSRKDQNENIFIAFLALLVLFSREFSYIKLPFIPLYSAELFILFFILFIVLLLLSGRSIKLVNCPKIEFALFLTLILYEIVYGLLQYDDILFVIRQSAIFYYSIFFFLTILTFNTIHKIDKLTKTLYASIIILIVSSIFGIVFANIGSFSYFYFSIALVAFLVYISLNKDAKPILKLITIILFILIALSEVRAVWVGISVGFLFAFVNSLNNKYFKLFTVKLFTIGTLILFVSFAGLLIAKPKAVNSIYYEFLSIFSTTKEHMTSSNNTKWRLYVWKDIINESMEKPVLGWGFGKKFVPPTIVKLNWGGSWRQPNINDPEAKGFQDPHNSFLNILHSTGIIGLFLFFLIIARVISHGLKAINNTSSNTVRTYLIALILIVVCILGTSLTMVVIEGPYFGIPFWVSLGLITAIVNISKEETGAKQN